MDGTERRAVLTIKQVAEFRNISVAVLRKAWKAPGSPRAIQLTPEGLPHYFADEVDAWFESRPRVDPATRTSCTASATTQLAKLRARAQRRGEVYRSSPPP